MANIKDIIGEDAYNTLSEEKKKELKDKNFEDVSGGKFVAKQRLDDEITKVKDLKTQKANIEKQLEELKKIDPEKLKEEIEKLQEENKKAKEQYEADIKERDFNNALDKALESYNAKNVTLVKALLNKENMKLDGDVIIGLKEQMDTIVKDNDYLFEKEVNTGSFGTGSSSSKETNKTENIATILGKQKAEARKNEGLNKFFSN